jgi:hypothetical protein
VLNGAGDAELLLESYEPERRPIAHDVVAQSAQRLHIAFASSTATRILRDIAVTVLGNLRPVQKMLQTQLSETQIVYRDGPLVALGEPPRNARRTDVGARARDALVVDADSGEKRPLWPLISDLRHTLLVFDDEGSAIDITAMAENVEDQLTVLRLSAERDPEGKLRDRFNQHGPGWVLIRPDHVVAARGKGGDLRLLDRYLDRVVRRRAVS